MAIESIQSLQSFPLVNLNLTSNALSSPEAILQLPPSIQLLDLSCNRLDALNQTDFAYFTNLTTLRANVAMHTKDQEEAILDMKSLCQNGRAAFMPAYNSNGSSPLVGTHNVVCIVDPIATSTEKTQVNVVVLIEEAAAIAFVVISGVILNGRRRRTVWIINLRDTVVSSCTSPVAMDGSSTSYDNLP
ncbi:hypothetical protein AC1031_017055 [Aphanomyces cochlioides]|nr:hypothetical protein AC1031_017055 [Aphanomyces cochlioides]